MKKDRLTSRGGRVVILIKQIITYTQVDFDTASIEAVGIKLNNNAIIVSAYVPN